MSLEQQVAEALVADSAGCNRTHVHQRLRRRSAASRHSPRPRHLRVHPDVLGLGAQRALRRSRYIVAIDSDPVAEAVRINPRGLTKVAILHTMGKPDVTIYRSSRP